MGRHGSEQSGVYQPFTTFLKANGISRNPLAPIRGNRFNILFYDAGVIYFISSLIKNSLLKYGRHLTSYFEQFLLMYKYQNS